MANDPVPQKEQTVDEGAGPVYHRTYTVKMPVSFGSAEEAMKRLQADINAFSPQLLARFEKQEGDPGEMREGDRYQIYLSAPWNGPVKVKAVTKHNFILATLEGHMEAGEISFGIEAKEGKCVAFRVESVARSRDRLVDLVYDKLPFARLAQTEMWERFCRAFATESFRIERSLDPELAEDLDVKVRTEKLGSEGKWEQIS